MYRIKNTADDRSKHLLHRTANQFELEPQIGGHRIRLRSYLDITDEHYERVKHMVDAWVRKGIVEVSKVGPDFTGDPRKFAADLEFDSNGLRLGGPTFEVWTEKLQQPPESYPPEGFAEVFSPGLVAYKRAKEEADQEAVKKKWEPFEPFVQETMSKEPEPQAPVQESVVEESANQAPPILQVTPTSVPPAPPAPSLKSKKLR